MALLKEAIRNTMSASLAQAETQGINAINILKALKTQLPIMKTTVTNDSSNFNAADIADVQIVIDSLLAGIAGI
jgi:hypothetical protein